MRIWVNTVFTLTSPEDRNCEICQRTKFSRAPCRRRIGGAVPRAENFGDLITADHKVLNNNCESQDGSSRISTDKKLLRKHKGACKSSWSRIGHLKSFYIDNSLGFTKDCEDLSCNHCTSTSHRSETNEIAERAVRRVKEGTSAILLQSSLEENWWRIPWNAILICETFKISYLMGRLHTKDVLENH